MRSISPSGQASVKAGARPSSETTSMCPWSSWNTIAPDPLSPPAVTGERGEHRPQRRRDDIRMDAHAPPKGPVAADGLHIRGRGGVGALADGVLRVVDHVEGGSEPAPQRVHEGGDGAIARARHRAVGTLHHELSRDARALVACLGD